MIKTFSRYLLWLTLSTFLLAQLLVWLNHLGVPIPAALLILLIPIILYFAFREMMVKHWDYKLPVLKVLVTGLLLVALAAVFLTLLHSGVKYYSTSAEERQLYTIKWLMAYMIGYVKWYLIFALGSIPIAYGILLWQLRSKK